MDATVFESGLARRGGRLGKNKKEEKHCSLTGTLAKQLAVFTNKK